MTPDRWQRVIELFEEAVGLPADEREDLLRERCAGDEELQEEVERLLLGDAIAERENFLAPPNETDLEDGRTLPQHPGIHINCPHCRNPIELVDLRAPHGVFCPTCGSTFELVEPMVIPQTMAQGGASLARFRLIESVGSGAFGTVFKAHDPRLDRIVALKVLRAGNLAGADHLTRFLADARSAAQLRHPAIVPIYEVGDHQGVPFIVREFIQGHTLSELIKRGRPTSQNAARLAAELADALQYAHDSGVVHRDVKSQNIMIDDAGRPFLMDFGMAKREASEITITMEGQLLGTPAYMSPEQAAGETGNIDRRSDVYSLGVVLYEMLTGELPFRGNTTMLLEQVRHDEPRPPHKLNDRVPPELETICLKAMAKEPPLRYQTALEFRDDLRNFLEHRPIKARPVGAIGRARRWCRRNPLIAALSGTTAASALIAAGFLALYALGQHHRLLESRRHLATVSLALGRAACERGEIGPGLLWLERSLRAATQANDRTRARVARENLVAWSRELPGLRAVFSHDGEVQDASFSPDGATVATGGADRIARLWSLSILSPIGNPLLQEGAVSSTSFSPDGRVVMTAGLKGGARLWDAGNGAPLHAPLPHEGEVYGGDFSPDGTILLTASHGSNARIWEVTTGRLVGELVGHKGRVLAADISPDGKLALTAGDDGTARLWDLATRRPRGVEMVHGGPVWAAGFSPDGRSVVTASGDRTARLWEATSGKALQVLRHDGAVWSSRFSPDGRSVVTAGEDNTARLWETAGGRPIGRIMRHDDDVSYATFSPDGRRVVTSSWDQTARLWDSTTGQPIGPAARHLGRVNRAAFSRDGTSMVTASVDHSARVWDVASFRRPVRVMTIRDDVTMARFGRDGELILVGTHGGELLAVESPGDRVVASGPTLGNPICELARSPDGTLALAGTRDGQAVAWDVRTGRPMHPTVRFAREVTKVLFSPDGKTAIATSSDGSARLWEVATGRVIGAPLLHPETIVGAAFSPDGKVVVTGGTEGTVRMWDAATGASLGTPLKHDDAVYCLAFAPDGRSLLTGGKDHRTRFWDPGTGRIRSIVEALEGSVWRVAFSPDGRTAIAGTIEGTARLLDAETGATRGEPLSHRGWIFALGFSPDGLRALTCSADGSAKLWDTATGLQIGPTFQHRPGDSVTPAEVRGFSFRPDGAEVLTFCEDGKVRVWEIPEAGNLPDSDRWVKARTGLDLGEDGAVKILDSATWSEIRRRESEGGGNTR